jgi:phosphate transport system substrate-binding protein
MCIQETADLLKEFWTWATQSDEADEIARDLGYAPLGESLKAQVADALERINEDG